MAFPPNPPEVLMSRHRHRRPTRALALAAAALAIAATPAAAMPIDPPVGGGHHQQLSGPYPDHLDPSVSRPTEAQTFPGLAGRFRDTPHSPAQDLRSPDTRDVAAERKYPPTPTVVSLKKVQPPAQIPATGFDWAAAATGAVSALSIILLMTAAALIVTRRRASRDQPVAAA
jgi:hypothetical protein